MALPGLERYSRQTLFAGIGEPGQARLLQSSVVIAGCGALGSFQAAALARAGIGRLRLIDRDYVEPSNLQRQWLYEESDAEDALPKAAAAERRLRAINSSIRIEGLVADITPETIEDLFANPDLILDGTDNFDTRYLINDYAVRAGIPWIYGGAVGSYGVTMPVVPGLTACLKCVYPEPPSGAQPTCDTAGILGPATALVASLQVSQALRILTGAGPVRKIASADVWTGELRQLNLPAPDPACPACGQRRFIHLDAHRRAPISLCGRNAVQIHELSRPLELDALARRLRPLGTVRSNDFAVRFETPPYMLTVFSDGRVIVKGTTDPAIARSLYARYISA